MGAAGGAVAAADLPPWDPDLLLAGYWLAAVPCLCILIGLAASVRNLVRQPSIAAWLLLGHPGPFGMVSDEVQREADRLVAAYASRLPAVLPQRQGRVLANVPGALELVDRHPAITSWVVTGNVEAGAVAKLQHYGLAHYFAPAAGGRLRGAFSERVEPRFEIVGRAAAEARRLDPTLTLAEMLVIGDTPHDIEGARSVGIPTLALASNTHTVDELEAHRPWLTLPALPEADAFGALLAQRFQPTTA